MAGTTKAVVLFTLVPLVFYTILAVIKKVSDKETWMNSFNQLVLVILPITACMHLFKALLKITSRIPYLNYVFSDFKGVQTAQMLMNHTKVLNKNVLNTISPLISLFAILLPAGGLVLSLLIIRKQQHLNRTSRIVSIFAALVYAGMFLVFLTAWRVF